MKKVTKERGKAIPSGGGKTSVCQEHRLANSRSKEREDRDAEGDPSDHDVVDVPAFRESDGVRALVPPLQNSRPISALMAAPKRKRI